MFSKNFVKTFLIASTIVGVPAMAAQTTEGNSISKGQVRVNTACGARAKFDRKGAFFKKLGLTDEQLAKIASLKDQNLITTASQKAQLRAFNDQLKEVLTRSDVNKQDAMQLQSKINDIRSQLANERLEYRLQFLSVLTPEQTGILRHRMLVSDAFNSRSGRHISDRQS